MAGPKMTNDRTSEHRGLLRHKPVIMFTKRSLTTRQVTFMSPSVSLVAGAVTEKRNNSENKNNNNNNTSDNTYLRRLTHAQVLLPTSPRRCYRKMTPKRLAS